VGDPGDGPAVEAPVGHGVDVVEEVGHPDDALASVLGEKGRFGQQLGDPSTGSDGLERREAEGDDLVPVQHDVVVRLGCARH
jgi:hypothetical protein